MGLLTNPNSSSTSTSKLLTMIRTHAGWVSWLLYFAGIVFFLAMVHPEYSHKTYFSENALLPGLVMGEFDENRAAQHYLDSLKLERKAQPSAMPTAWIKAQFRQMGLEAYSHNFSLNSPLSPSG